jgi:hypothetical protein
VAGVETLSQAFGNPPTEWNDWHESTSWEKFITTQELSASQADALRRKLVKKGSHLRLQETFSHYASSRIPESFWEAEWDEYEYQYSMPAGVQESRHKIGRARMADLVPKDRELLKLSLKKTYNARSGYVHAGKHSIDLLTAIAIPNKGVFEDLPLPYLVLRRLLCSLIRSELDVEPVDPGKLDFRYTFSGE